MITIYVRVCINQTYLLINIHGLFINIDILYVNIYESRACPDGRVVKCPCRCVRLPHVAMQQGSKNVIRKFTMTLRSSIILRDFRKYLRTAQLRETEKS